MRQPETYLAACTLRLDHPSVVVKAVLSPERWLPRLRYVRTFERLTPGDRRGIGNRYRTQVRAVIPYRLTWQMQVVEVTETSVSWRSWGDLEGFAHLQVQQCDQVTAVTALWTVRPTARWMTALWPLGRRLFVRNHDAIMHHGARRLADYLGVDLIGFTVGP